MADDTQSTKSLDNAADLAEPRPGDPSGAGGEFQSEPACSRALLVAMLAEAKHSLLSAFDRAPDSGTNIVVALADRRVILITVQ